MQNRARCQLRTDKMHKQGVENTELAGKEKKCANAIQFLQKKVPFMRVAPKHDDCGMVTVCL